MATYNVHVRKHTPQLNGEYMYFIVKYFWTAWLVQKLNAQKYTVCTIMLYKVIFPKII